MKWGFNMDKKLIEAFHIAYSGEAKAALRLKVFAEKAEKEGYTQIAKLFLVIARSEEIHGARALRMLKEIGSTEENLQQSFESETDVAGVAYEIFVKMASELDDSAAMLTFSQAKDVEEVHAKLYKEAMNHMMEERETKYYVCKICGYVSDGALPEKCPVCAAPKDQFEDFV
jgi:rubrerythrin